MADVSLLTKCFFEFLGTLVLVLLGDGVVASNVLKKSKGFNGGWVVITMAWGFAVMCGVFIAGPYSGAHLNPAVSIGLAIAGHFSWSYVPGYIIAQFLGGFVGALLVYVFYKDHFDVVKEQISREPLPLCQLKLNPEVKSLFDFTIDDIHIENYQSHGRLYGKVSV